MRLVTATAGCSQATRHIIPQLCRGPAFAATQGHGQGDRNDVFIFAVARARPVALATIGGASTKGWHHIDMRYCKNSVLLPVVAAQSMCHVMRNDGVLRAVYRKCLDFKVLPVTLRG